MTLAFFVDVLEELGARQVAAIAQDARKFAIAADHTVMANVALGQKVELDASAFDLNMSIFESG